MTDDFLNIGFDRNNNEQSNTFYNTGSGWMSSMFEGALMIRPVFGAKLPLVAGIDEISNSDGKLFAYPNPCSGNNITLVLPSEADQDNSKLRIHMYDMLGKEVLNIPYKNNINVSGMQNGIYLLKVISDNTGQSFLTRISIIK